jgi:hypothetical protein
VVVKVLSRVGQRLTFKVINASRGDMVRPGSFVVRLDDAETVFLGPPVTADQATSKKPYAYLGLSAEWFEDNGIEPVECDDGDGDPPKRPVIAAM